jgi:tRNA(fMet)-specific endonuclease VapC
VERLIVDSSVLIQAERVGQPLESIADPSADVVIAAVTAAELWVGVELAKGQQRVARRAWVQRVLSRMPAEPYDLPVARAHASLLAHTRRSGRPRSAHDLLIAATAVARDRVVVTLDARGFEALPGVDYQAPA